MTKYVLDLQELTAEHSLELVGGKAFHLGQLHAMEGVAVPDGFCITTDAYKQFVQHRAQYNEWLQQLAILSSIDENESIRELALQIRQWILEAELPAELAEEVTGHLTRLGADEPYAVRSSATAEDLPHASFAGQQDSYLNVIGQHSLMQHIRACWASLFTERAVMYRIRNSFDHRQLSLCVIVQKMVFPEASGILFTADPLTSNRHQLAIDAGWGLGEALVSGIASADHYAVRDGRMTERRIAVKTTAIYPMPQGGTVTQTIEASRQHQQVLTDSQIVQLAQLGRQIEGYFGQPQDIEWCLANNQFYIVQSRPITTLYPIPESTEPGNRVYLSVGHQQMMTDVMRPLGLSFFLRTTRAPMRVAGGRLFVDATALLQRTATRKMLIEGFAQSDPLVSDAVQTVIDRGFIPLLDEPVAQTPLSGQEAESALKSSPAKGVSTPAHEASVEAELPVIDRSIVNRLVERTETSLKKLQNELPNRSGTEAMDYIDEDLQELRSILFEPDSMVVIKGAMDAFNWINRQLYDWLGEEHAADMLSQSIPGNVTSEMGLAVMELADTIRPFPKVIALLERTEDDEFLEQLRDVEGGSIVREAMDAYLQRYGMRCPGEIDLTRMRWSEHPAALIPLLLSSIKSNASDAGKQRFHLGEQRAAAKEAELSERIVQLPEGEQKLRAFQHYVRMLRELSGYREYPKYGMIRRYFIYKQAIMREAEHLVQTGVIRHKEDVYELTLEELNEFVRTRQADLELIEQRRRDDEQYSRLAPPRVITSEGETISGQYRQDSLPEGALPGTPVSAGVVEGRARVLHSMQEATLEEGDILVTPFTDPGWTPVFVTIKGLITEVGGVMTHGAVIAREYGLPAIVGVDQATTRIRDGQRIRLHGGAGYVELL
ncbi:phosphoenolpyruvate synthase [Paenibacillus hunanensis]|nr:phosphoenolpyruvate synthase [Paenibacillus hunanensis]GGJ03176.1 phosphoenolpyruvate synthase [Paenibacillus hunanensis]